MKGGLGIASVRLNELIVAAVAVVNAVGDVLDSSGSIIAGARTADGRWLADQDPRRLFAIGAPLAKANTTLVGVLTNARISKVDANRVAQRAHDGMARAIKPVHTSFDGDVTFTLASGSVETTIDILAEAGAEVTAAAIRDAVRSATSAAGVHGLRG